MTVPAGVLSGFPMALGVATGAAGQGAPNAAGDQAAVAAFSAALALAMGVRVPGTLPKGGPLTSALEPEGQSDPSLPVAEGDGESTSSAGIDMRVSPPPSDVRHSARPSADGMVSPDAALLSGIGMQGAKTEVPAELSERTAAGQKEIADDSSGAAVAQAPSEEFVAMPLAFAVETGAAFAPPSEAAIAAAIASDPLLSAVALRDGVPITARDLMRLANTDPATAKREMSGLVPELKNRLEHVIDRMRSEYGYDVQIVETVRTQERQDTLFAQGRSRPGPVVTWTRDSKHLDGRAADVVIDGSYENPMAFQILGKIAQEEGLRTLGPRDPGHIELPGAGVKQAAATTLSALPLSTGGESTRPSLTAQGQLPPTFERPLPMTSTPMSMPARAVPVRNEGAMAMTAGVAQVATVASVAQVATVARVASVSNVSTVSRVDGGERAPAVEPGRMLESAVAGVVARQTSGGNTTTGERSDSSGREERRASVAEVVPGTTRPADVDALVASLRHDGNTANLFSSGEGGAPIDGIAHSDASERIARLLKVQDAAAERPLTQLLLRVDAPDGTQDRIRVDMRGTSIGATFDVGSARAANQLNAHVGELQHALERQGLEAESLTVRTVARDTESGVSHALAVSAEREGTRATASSAFGGSAQQQPGGRESRAFTRPDDSRQGSDHRHRSPKEQKGEK